MTRRFLVSLVLVSFLAACANQGGGYGQAGTSSGINKEMMGSVGGAVVGGLLGSKVGKGSGQLWATGAGAVLGGLAGNSIGASLDRADQSYANQAFSQAAVAPVGQQINWSNPESGNSGTYVTTRTGRTNDGRVCREFQQRITVGGKVQEGVGQACQQSDGSWAIQPN